MLLGSIWESANSLCMGYIHLGLSNMNLKNWLTPYILMVMIKDTTIDVECPIQISKEIQPFI